MLFTKIQENRTQSEYSSGVNTQRSFDTKSRGTYRTGFFGPTHETNDSFCRHIDRFETRCWKSTAKKYRLRFEPPVGQTVGQTVG